MKHTLLTLSLLVVVFAMAGCSSSAPSGPPVEARDGRVDEEPPGPVPRFEQSPLVAFQQRAFENLRRHQVDEDTPIFATVSFASYIPAAEVVREAEVARLRIHKVGVQLHDYGFMVPFPGGATEESIDAISRLLRQRISALPMSQAYRDFLSQTLEEHGWFAGAVVVEGIPSALVGMWQGGTSVRLIEPKSSIEVTTGGIAPEYLSEVSHFTRAEEIVQECEEAPDVTIPWPALPARCNR